MITIIPVIHYASDDQALRNAERAFDAGCEGVMLIEMGGLDHLMMQAARGIKARWPEKRVGLNFLTATEAYQMPSSVVAGFDMTWTDQQLTHSGGPLTKARYLRDSLKDRPDHQVFCAVAFKYQPIEPYPALAAHVAAELGFIPTTSGPATGSPANTAALASIRTFIGPDAPLAIASGVTPENVGTFDPFVSHALVSTGISASFHEFDPVRLRDLMEAAR